MKHTILLVDDEKHILDALERLFRQKYHIIKALSGAEGLELLETHKPTVIISDQRMPTMNGVQFLAQSMEKSPDSLRILLTGYTDIESVIEAINLGQIYRYVTKPWEAIDLTNAVEKAIEKHELRSELEIKNKELEKAYNELKTLDQAKTHFMYLINHELKTPLTVISSYVQLVQETELDEMQKKSIHRIQEGQLRLQTLIDDVLQVVEAETGLVKTSIESVNIKKELENLVKSFDQQTSDKSLSIQFDLEKDKLKTDKQIFNKVTQRILDNGIKFSDPSENIEIILKTSKKWAVLSFINTGKKFPQEKIQQLLKPFAIDENILNHSLGTGLGLSISNALMHCLGGNLKIDSQENQTTVSLEFPIS